MKSFYLSCSTVGNEFKLLLKFWLLSCQMSSERYNIRPVVIFSKHLFVFSVLFAVVCTGIIFALMFAFYFAWLFTYSVCSVLLATQGSSLSVTTDGRYYVQTKWIFVTSANCTSGTCLVLTWWDTRRKLWVLLTRIRVSMPLLLG